MLAVFFYVRGLIHHEGILEGTTMTGAFYIEVLKHLHEFIRQVRPILWKNKSWILLTLKNLCVGPIWVL